jgi:N-formylglutamate amidohydrolase
VSRAPDLWTYAPGTLPVLVNVPHAGTYVPPAMAERLTDEGRAVPDTDWHVAALYDFAPMTGVGLLAATHSRFVVDLNRDPDGVPLYPGADNTETVPTRTFQNAPVWRPGAAPDAAEIAERVRLYWRPYHARVADEVAALRRRHGHCILLDGHSIRSVLPRFFDGKLPDLNLGTASGASAALGVQQAAEAVLATTNRFTFVSNGRFKGGYITRHYGRPAEGAHALQLEMAISAYADEAAPERLDRARTAPLVEVLQRLVAALVAWRPER